MRRKRGLRTFLVLSGIVVVLGTAAMYCIGEPYRKAADGISSALRRKLTVRIPLPSETDVPEKKARTMIYVLGSTQDALLFHFQTAARLYKKGVSDKIHILSRPGITEYSPDLMRNLTNDEWASRELQALGVPAKDVEAIEVPACPFGTISEGKQVSRVARERGYERIILVSSPHHTRRVYLTFSCFLGDAREMFLYGSDHPAGPGDLVAEYGKYILYRYILIPARRLVDPCDAHDSGRDSKGQVGRAEISKT